MLIKERLLLSDNKPVGVFYKMGDLRGEDKMFFAVKADCFYMDNMLKYYGIYV